MSAPERPALLLLGGTAEAVALAGRMVEAWGDRFEVVTSLAGRTRAPARPAGRVRVGGFGGAAALADYLRTHDVRAVIDATHPFAARISANAASAAARARVPRLVLVRPPWEPAPGDDWRVVPDIDAAAAAVPDMGRRVFLTVGRTELAAFRDCRDTWFLVRMIDPPDAPLPLPDATVVTGRGPFDVNAERDLLREHKIDALVCKASGGMATRAKLDAARALDLPVLMVARPAPPDGPRAEDVDAALGWLREQLT
jgi:precorrin-6A/cobalt-precorrin-6A reductase